MLRLKDFPYSMLLTQDKVKSFWNNNGSRWVFPDRSFMDLREEIGLDTHIIQFHTPYWIVSRANGKEAIVDDPAITFKDPRLLLKFKLML